MDEFLPYQALACISRVVFLLRGTMFPILYGICCRMVKIEIYPPVRNIVYQFEQGFESSLCYYIAGTLHMYWLRAYVYSAC